MDIRQVSAIDCRMDVTARPLSTASRNRLCSCGSGLRYKGCCGALALPRVAAASGTRRQEGLRLHLGHALLPAVAAYDDVLRQHPSDWDVAHMRALALYQLGAFEESCTAFAVLLETPARDLPGFWQNLGLLVAAVAHDVLDAEFQRNVAQYQRFQIAREQRVRSFQEPFAGSSTAALPTVSVVMPAYNHEFYVAESVRSVLAQTRLPCEFIVIDDGSTDNTLAVLRQALAVAPMPVKLITSDNRGASSALNEAIGRAQGSVIQLLNSDDRLHPERVAVMSMAFAALPAQWATARVRCMDSDGTPLHANSNPRAREIVRNQDAALQCHTHGLSLLANNHTISTGNLTFRKTLWQQLGGFRDYRYNHDWDFALRASLVDEPLLMTQSLYDYRLHDSNTIAESSEKARAEVVQVMKSFVQIALVGAASCQRFAPIPGVWKSMWFACIAASEGLQHVPAALLRRQLLDRVPARRAPAA